MRKILFTIASCITGTAIFIACSNEETFETVENYSATQQSHKKQLKTRGCTMKIEEVEDIFNRLNEKYNTNWFLPENPNLAGYTEDFFLYLENLTRKDLGLEPLSECSVKGVTTYSLWDDSLLDEIAVASTSISMVESNVLPDITFNKNHTIYDANFTRLGMIFLKSTEIPVKRFHFDVTYNINYNTNNGPQIATFVSFSDETRENEANIYTDSIKGQLTEDRIEEIFKECELSYVKSSFTSGNINIRYINDIDPENVVAEDFEFKFNFDIKIKNDILDVSGSHPEGILGVQVKNNN